MIKFDISLYTAEIQKRKQVTHTIKLIAYQLVRWR